MFKVFFYHFVIKVLKFRISQVFDVVCIDVKVFGAGRASVPVINQILGSKKVFLVERKLEQ
jgi:hypothetical protein